MIRKPNNEIMTEIYDDAPWDTGNLIPLEVKRGTLIVLHGLLPHMSKENKSPRSRHAYSLHIIHGNDGYPKENWLQRATDLPLTGFME
jgi:phytanoyl-CoA hydroxylase